MNKSTIGTVLITTTLAAVIGSYFFSQSAISHDSDNESFFMTSKYNGVLPVNNATYQTECSDCHMAYSPGLLPSKSWQKVMANLDNHFGDNAEVSTENNQTILNYLLLHSAEKSKYRRSIKIARSLSGSSTNKKVIDRISQTPYFMHKHDEIPKKFVIDNPKVGSFSQCNVCHLNAEKGSFNEDEVSIPGVGYWHD